MVQGSRGLTRLAVHAAALNGVLNRPQTGVQAPPGLKHAQAQLARRQLDGLGRRVSAVDGVEERQVCALPCAASSAHATALLPLPCAHRLRPSAACRTNCDGCWRICQGSSKDTFALCLPRKPCTRGNARQEESGWLADKARRDRRLLLHITTNAPGSLAKDRGAALIARALRHAHLVPPWQKGKVMHDTIAVQWEHTWHRISARG